MTSLAMFPIGSVLFPYMPLPLRVFEERYLVMLSRVLQSEPAQFGVVLIERGQEVGGGEKRFSYGTIARVTQVDAGEGFIGLVAQGSRRIEVLDWLPEDPHPLAEVREIDELVWDDDLLPAREEAERAVRRALALASEFSDQLYSADVALSHDPVAAAWQLAGIAPIGPLDQIDLLKSESMEQLLESVREAATAAQDTFRTPWADDQTDDQADDQTDD